MAKKKHKKKKAVTVRVKPKEIEVTLTAEVKSVEATVDDAVEKATMTDGTINDVDFVVFEPPTADTDTNVGEIVKENADEHDETFRKLAEPESIGLNNAQCDTCSRVGVVMQCLNCGKTYCNRCRTPHIGHYPTCQGCEQGLPR